MSYTNYLLTAIEVNLKPIKPQTETSPYLPSRSGLNAARQKFDIFP